MPISIICCSENLKNIDALKANISKTIGVIYEFILIWNKDGVYSLTQAYNRGVIKTKYDIICYCHDDIEFITMDWGKQLNQEFEKGFDVIGVAGNDSHPKSPSGWWVNSRRTKTYANVWQEVDKGNPYLMKMLKHNNHILSNNRLRYTFNGGVQQVVAIDGLLMCFKKHVFDTIGFDESLSGFHGYDIDISLQCYQKFKVGVTNKIDLVHQSAGVINKDWCDSAFEVYKKWKSVLPISVKPYSKADLNVLTIRSALAYLIYLVDIGFSKFEIQKMLKDVVTKDLFYSSPIIYVYLMSSIYINPYLLNRIRLGYVQVRNWF